MAPQTHTQRRVVLSDRVPPARLEGEDVHLDPSRSCTYCGHAVQVARVVRLLDDSYAYACHGCAVRT